MPILNGTISVDPPPNSQDKYAKGTMVTFVFLGPPVDCSGADVTVSRQKVVMNSDRFVALTIRPTPTPIPTPTPTPTATPKPTPTPTPLPTATPLPLLGQSQAESLMLIKIAQCKNSIDEQYGATTTVVYLSQYLGNQIWLVNAYWPAGNMSYGGWRVGSRTWIVKGVDSSA